MMRAAATATTDWGSATSRRKTQPPPPGRVRPPRRPLVARASPQREGDRPPSSSPPPSPLGPLAGALVAGGTAGPLLDAIHSSVGLQVYDLLPLDLGPLHTSALVPPLLAAFYATLTALDAAAERFFEGGGANADDETTAAAPPAPLATVAACYASLAAGLSLSAFLHARQVPPAQIALALSVFAAANFAAFDRTRRGAALALLCAVVAPLAEAQLMARFGAWHYPRADVQVPVLFADFLSGGGAGALPPPPASAVVGFVSWVPLCYFFYAPSVLLLGRRLRAAERNKKHKRDHED